MLHVTLDRAGLSIAGRPLYLLAGQLHYFRYPRAEWRDLLLKAKAGGLNTIDTVIPWNLHEPIEGQFDFSAEADLPGYLDLCAELGLLAIVRPGPYICAEWENGGFPAWLTAKSDVELRIDNPIYREHTLRWFDTLMPILAERQATRGGPIVLCQIENEHWASGRYGHDDHQATLARAAIERGIDVPQYTCMGAMRDWAEFRNGWNGIAEKLQQTRAVWSDNPLIVSELWSGWFDNWGASRHNHKSAARLDLIMHQLLAVGASGISHWMWAGGTNFDMWGGRTVGGDTIHMTTSYDYDAPVSEYGGLTDKYYVARRHHLFLGSIGIEIASVLADATPGGPTVIAPAAVAGRGEAGAQPYRAVRAAGTAPDRWRRMTATFLQNATLDGQTYQFFAPDAHLAIEVEAASIRPIFTDLPLGEAWRIAFHTSRILGFWPRHDADLLICYGAEGEAGHLRIAATERSWEIIDDGGARCRIVDDALDLRYWIADRPTVIRARAGRALTIVLLTQARAERWWPLDDGAFVAGPDYVQLRTDDSPVEIERRGVLPFYRVGLDGTIALIQPSAPATRRDSPVVWHSAAPESSRDRLHWTRHAIGERMSEQGWRSIAEPLPLEAMDCLLGYGWYRSQIDLPHDRRTTLAAPWLSDRARVLIDGDDMGWLGVDPDGPRMTLPIDLRAGHHDVRLLVDNLGRFNYGSHTGERKGLLDTLYWDAAQHDITGGWTALWQEAVFAGEAIARATPASVRPDATNVRLDSFAFHGPSVWLLRDITARPDRRYVLHITGDRNPGALFVNGVAVARFSRHDGGGYIKQDITDRLRAGSNTLALTIQGYAAVAWRATLLEYDPRQAVAARWSFRAGVSIGDEQPDDRSGPCFWRARFSYDRVIHGDGPFRLALPGLRKGHIWLNDRGIGRYWQIGPQEYYKIPASWLRDQNELRILEETGAAPHGVWIGGDERGANRRFVLVT